MVEISEIRSTVEATTAANCLMLLSRVGQGHGGDTKRVFTCKTCFKEFHSFQALGGHRASHKKPNNNENLPALMKKVKTPSSHPCPICGVEFPMGQALGGHMRKHRNENGGGGGVTLVTRALLPEPTTVTTLKRSSSGKRVACLDLSLGMVENLNLELELGRTVS